MNFGCCKDCKYTCVDKSINSGAVCQAVKAFYRNHFSSLLLVKAYSRYGAEALDKECFEPSAEREGNYDGNATNTKPKPAAWMLELFVLETNLN